MDKFGVVIAVCVSITNNEFEVIVCNVNSVRILKCVKIKRTPFLRFVLLCAYIHE